ncbi:hypothetical protein HEBU111660_06565 [Helicobacter burdigaliensis]
MLALISTAEDWKGFADSWNKSESFRNIAFDEFRLTNDIDMQGEAAVEVDPVGHTYAFNKNFNGMGYTLSNVKINANQRYTGLFGRVEGDNLKIGNVKIDGLEFDYKEGYLPQNIGGFAGYIEGKNMDFSNISLSDIGIIESKHSAGGFAGGIDTTSSVFSNILLKDYEGLEGNNILGGFVGFLDADGSEFSNIVLSFENLTISNDSFGAFAGASLGFKDAKFSNIHMYYENIAFEEKGKMTTFIGDYAGNYLDNTSFDNVKFFTDSTKDSHFIEDVNAEIKISEIGDKVDSQFGNIKYENGDFVLVNNEDNTSYPTEEINMPTNKGELTNVQDDLSSKDFSQEILKQILGNLNFDLLNDDIDSIIQTLDFLRYFNKEDIGIQSLFSEDYTLANNNQSDNLFNSFTKIKEELEKLRDEDLKNYKDSVNNFNAKYVQYLKDKEDGNFMNEEHLKGVEKELLQEQKDLLARQEAINNLLKDFKKALEPMQEEFSLEGKTPIAMFDNNSLNFTLKLPSVNEGCIGKCVNGGAGDDQTLTTPLKDINASMINKEKVVLVKPAEEEKEAIEEEEGTLNSRTCVVSENFKTNNPCMAQRI